MMDGLVQRCEPFHTRARRTHDEYRRPARREVLEEVHLIARLQQVDAAHDVEVRASSITSTHCTMLYQQFLLNLKSRRPPPGSGKVCMNFSSGFRELFD